MKNHILFSVFFKTCVLLLISMTAMAASPVFEPSHADNPLKNIIQITPGTNTDFFAPKTVDIDGDGDLDVMLVSSSGVLYFVKNSSQSATSFSFTDDPQAVALSGLSTNYFSAGFINISGTDLPDMFISENLSNTLRYFENTSAEGNIQFTENSSANPFNGKNLAFYNIDDSTFNFGFRMAFADMDDDGDKDIIFGVKTAKYTNRLIYYENTGGNNFEEGLSNPFSCVSSNDFPAPDLADIDGDGDYDLVVGSSRQIKYYENTGTKYHAQFVPKDSEDNCLSDDNAYHCEVTPASSSDEYYCPAFADFDGDGTYALLVGFRDDSEFQYWSIAKAVLPGDINGKDGISLSDAILGLKILADADTFGDTVNLAADVDTNQKIGLEEV
ncbi:MAG: VCBS repeat-containing protein, partial [Desulfococcaceae bacterium]|nr:VCBS repeat-containing protein [Desulfococcaceae bacterium]